MLRPRVVDVRAIHDAVCTTSGPLQGIVASADINRCLALHSAAPDQPWPGHACPTPEHRHLYRRHGAQTQELQQLRHIVRDKSYQSVKHDELQPDRAPPDDDDDTNPIIPPNRLRLPLRSPTNTLYILLLLSTTDLQTYST